jgi:hypothetical protein
MPHGIRPTNDFAFKKTFGTPGNRLALISLRNAILDPNPPIVDVTIENPYNLQETAGVPVADEQDSRKPRLEQLGRWATISCPTFVRECRCIHEG